MSSRHVHHSDARSAFRLVRSRQAWGTILALLSGGLVLLLWPSASPAKLPALIALGAGFVVFSHRNWRCPKCGIILPYGRVPNEFMCPRCETILNWSHPGAPGRPAN
jgi:sterol desaturase/sphingolipid hydroxylase (fatty acid hydroxylase superfamily)